MQNNKTKNIDKTMAFVIKTVRLYDPDPAHSEQVSKLAVALFDELRILHNYNDAERRLIEIAAWLHDIGWSQAVSGKHHKLSRDMIKELVIPGLGKHDKNLCALIARYHTKALPDVINHRQFAVLEPENRDLVEWLAGILRVADGLDCNHAEIIRQLKCEVADKVITIKLNVMGDCRRELEKARQKQDLLLKKTGKKIEYQC